MTRWGARIIEDPTVFMRNRVRLVVGYDRGPEGSEEILEDGTAFVFTDGTPADPDRKPVGFLLPSHPEALEAIGQAVDRYRDLTDRRLLEARVSFLEEALTRETARAVRAEGAIRALVPSPDVADVFTALNPRRP